MRPTGRAYTDFHNTQDNQAFPPDRRFLLARPHLKTVWTGHSRFTPYRVLPCWPVLEPCMQLSLHTAQSCAVTRLATE